MPTTDTQAYNDYGTTNIQSFSLEKVLLMRTPIPFMSRTKPEFEAKASVNILIF